MSQNVIIIQSWPAQMRKETAAAYVDARSVQAFDRAVKAGIYPRPYHRPGEGDRWLRTELDTALAAQAPAAEDDGALD